MGQELFLNSTCNIEDPDRGPQPWLVGVCTDSQEGESPMTSLVGRLSRQHVYSEHFRGFSGSGAIQQAPSWKCFCLGCYITV